MLFVSVSFKNIMGITFLQVIQRLFKYISSFLIQEEPEGKPNLVETVFVIPPEGEGSLLNETLSTQNANYSPSK